MDRVERALEKARLQREGAEGIRVSEVPPDGPPVSPKAIVYDRTRQEKVSPKTLEKSRLVAGLENDWRANPFKVLRAQVLKRMSQDGLRTIGITSAAPGDGKSLIAANLAMSIALDINQTVLLVDLDLRRARIASYFGLKPEQGLSDYLLEKCPLEDCLVNPGIDRLVLLPEKGAVSNSSELLGSPRMKDLAQELKERYADRIVIYDLPPLFAGDDALVIAPSIDSMILTVQAGKTTKNEIESSLSLLRDTKLIGTVLNRGTQEEKYYYH